MEQSSSKTKSVTTPTEVSTTAPHLRLEIVTQRTATKGLTTRLLDLSTAAFAEDDAFSWRYPKRNEYPSYNRWMFWKYLGASLLSPNNWVVVAYLKEIGEDGEEREVVVGHGVWERRGKTGDEEAKRDYFLQRIERWLFALHVKINDFFFPNPAANKLAIALMSAFVKELKVRASKIPNFENQYHLNFLGVDPKYQRRGVGAAIVNWGVDKARKAGLSCSLEASQAGKRVYTKCGFREEAVCDPFHGEVWKDGMHCQDIRCRFSVGSFMIWQPDFDLEGTSS
ncbi:hypothetical protein ABW19_dt0206084 [Dactylella cylindrospora]|nr:hypothetical protein ABW19_dt0206084 [Dactylella cylindrospora]